MKDREIKPYYQPAEQARKHLLRDHTNIRFEDYGTGGNKNRFYSTTLAKLARNSGKRNKEGRLLARLSAWWKPSVILELGTSLGISTLYLKAGNPSARLITIEGCREVSLIARQNFMNYGFNDIEQITAIFEDALPELISRGIKPGMVFFDGNHDYLPTLEYFNRLLPLATPETLYIFDDIHWSIAMDKAWEKISAHPRVSLSIDLFSMGLVFFKENFPKQHFILRF